MTIMSEETDKTITSVSPSPGQLTPVVPDHELLRCIGHGSYGEVWLARTVTGQHRAVKIVSRKNFKESRPFDREFAGMKRYEPISHQHPGLVRILHVGINQEAGYFYYMMEVADDQTGGQQFDPCNYTPKTIASELHHRKRLPFEECVAIGLTLSAALAHLHQSGLVHRDIKPANIIFVNGAAKLVDIGLVAEADSTMTFVGTEGYIPPEGPRGPQADIYALGKVLYEISTGKDRLSFPEFPTDLAELPDRQRLLGLNTVVLKACESDSVRRYLTASQMHNDLTHLQSGVLPVTDRLRRFLIASVILVVAASGLAILMTHPKPKLAPQAKLTDEKKASTVLASAQLEELWSTPLGFDRAFIGDINGDGQPKLVAGGATGFTVFSGRGREVFIVTNCGSLVYVADMNGDGKAEIFTSDRTADGLARTTAYDANGKPLQTYVIKGSNDTNLAPFHVSDLNGDGRWKVVAIIGSSWSRGPRGVVVFDAVSGSEIGRTEVGPALHTLPWVGPVFGDVRSRIIFGGSGIHNGRVGADGSNDASSYVWCLDDKGKTVWRHGPFDSGGFYDSAVVVPELRPDNRHNIIVSASQHGRADDWEGQVGRLMMLSAISGQPQPEYFRDFHAPVRVVAAARLIPDADMGILVLREAQSPKNRFLHLVQMKPGFPDWRIIEVRSDSPQGVLVKDLDGDGKPEVIFWSGNQLSVLANNLRPLCSWKRRAGFDIPINGVKVADLNDDGVTELIVESGASPGSQRIDILRFSSSTRFSK